MNTKVLSIAAVAAVLIGSSAIAQAQMDGDRKGPSAQSPGHQMQEKGSVPGQPGASGFAPGHTKAGDADDKLGGRDRDDKAARGDRDDKKMRGDRDDRTTGFGGHDRDDRLRGDRDDRKMDSDRRGIDKE